MDELSTESQKGVTTTLLLLAWGCLTKQRVYFMCYFALVRSQFMYEKGVQGGPRQNTIAKKHIINLHFGALVT